MMFDERTQIDGYIEAVPKAELHVHLEGSIQPATLLMLAQRNDVKLPVQTVEDLQEWFTFSDFDHFIEIYFEISSCLKTSDDYELIAYEFGANMARQNVRYAEVTLEFHHNNMTNGLSKTLRQYYIVRHMLERQLSLKVSGEQFECLVQNGLAMG